MGRALVCNGRGCCFPSSSWRRWPHECECERAANYNTGYKMMREAADRAILHPVTWCCTCMHTLDQGTSLINTSSAVTPQGRTRAAGHRSCHIHASASTARLHLEAPRAAPARAPSGGPPSFLCARKLLPATRRDVPGRVMKWHGVSGGCVACFVRSEQPLPQHPAPKSTHLWSFDALRRRFFSMNLSSLPDPLSSSYLSTSASRFFSRSLR